MKITDLSLISIKYFVDSIELGSLTEAAHKNTITRPAISQAIRRLEEGLGYELISHEKNSLALTDHGRSFLAKAKLALQVFEKAFSEDAEADRKINLACSHTLLEFLILPALKKFKSVPHIRTKIGATSRVRELVASGETNLGFIVDDGQTFGFQGDVIKDGTFVVCSLSGKLEAPLVITEQRPETLALAKALKKKKKTVAQTLEIESWSACRKTAELMGGTCLIPDMMTGSMKRVREVDFQFPYSIKVIYNDRNLLSAAEIALINALS